MRFIRKNGHIIPISDKAKIGAAVIGAHVASTAIRTKTIFQKGGTSIESTKFTIQPFFRGIGDKLSMHVDGKKVGTASIRVKSLGSRQVGEFTWLGVKGSQQGKGYGKTLSEHGARELKKKGVNSIHNFVASEKGLKTRFTPGRDVALIGEKKASVASVTKLIKAGSRNVFRETSLAGVHTNKMIPFRTLGNKLKIVGGIAIAATALASLFHRKKEA